MKKGIITTAIVVVVVLGVVLMASQKKDSNKAANGAGSSTQNGSATSNNGSAGNMSTMNGADGTQSKPSSAPSPSSSSTGASQATSEKVAIQNFTFSPTTLTVKKGATVTWTNDDTVQHTVTIDSGTGPHSQPLNKGDTYTYTFSAVGTYKYHCSFHSNMTASVTVTE